MVIRKNNLTAFDFHGLAIFDFTAGINASSSFAVIEVPPGARHGRAKSNRSDKYYYVERGSVSFQLDGQEHALAEGDFCLVKQGKAFAYRNDTSEPARLILVHTPSFDPGAEEFIP
jgi:mannose-6-phosphate isomerase-like protein (cupin superfamily)